jgi:hypothetical protein
VGHALLVVHAFWEVLERLLPQRPAQRTGRPPVSDRAAFNRDRLCVGDRGAVADGALKEIGCSG